MFLIIHIARQLLKFGPGSNKQRRIFLTFLNMFLRQTHILIFTEPAPAACESFQEFTDCQLNFKFVIEVLTAPNHKYSQADSLSRTVVVQTQVSKLQGCLRIIGVLVRIVDLAKIPAATWRSWV